MNDTSLLERTRAYFQEYAALYMRSDAAAIANRFYEAPFVAVRRGEPIHMATTADVVEHLRGVMAAYRASGAAAAEIGDIAIDEQGNAAMLVTVDWHIRGPDHALIRELRTSYQIAGRDSWRILSYVNHDTVDA